MLWKLFLTIRSPGTINCNHDQRLAMNFAEEYDSWKKSKPPCIYYCTLLNRENKHACNQHSTALFSGRNEKNSTLNSDKLPICPLP